MQTIIIGSDHAGFQLKQEIKAYLEQKGFGVKDVGAWTDESSDYPDFGHALANEVEKSISLRGISICGSGNGINMSANKHQGIRAALCWNSEIARLARSHNDANICSLPARFVTSADALQIVDTFLSTPFEGGRHQRRVDKIPLM